MLRLLLLLNAVFLVPYVSLVPLDFSGFQFDSDPVNNSLQIVAVNNSNGTDKDLYVIKTIVYEVALLTEALGDDDGSNDTYTQEQVNLTFYNAHGNGTHVDLGHIPIPVQANVSGHIVTGIAPVRAGTLPEDPELLAALLPEGATVSFTRTADNDTAEPSSVAEDLLERLQELRNATDSLA